MMVSEGKRHKRVDKSKNLYIASRSKKIQKVKIDISEGSQRKSNLVFHSTIGEDDGCVITNETQFLRKSGAEEEISCLRNNFRLELQVDDSSKIFKRNEKLP